MRTAFVFGALGALSALSGHVSLEAQEIMGGRRATGALRAFETREALREGPPALAREAHGSWQPAGALEASRVRKAGKGRKATGALEDPVLQQHAGESFTLRELLEIGRERNPNLQALRARREALEADRIDGGRLQNPEIEVGWGQGDPFESPETKNLREMGVSQTIENPLVRHFRMGAYRWTVEAAEEEIRTGILQVEYEIRNHAYRILFLQEGVELARLNEEALDEIRALIDTRARLGEVKELEAIRLRVEHMRARNDVQAARLELTQFREHLNMFLGNALPAGYVLEGELASDLVVPELARLQDELLPRHPRLQQAALEREEARQTLKASRWSWLPDPVVSASSARELDGEVVRWGVGFQVPLWNQSRAATRREENELLSRIQEEEGLRLDLQARLMIHHNHLQLHRQTLQLFQEGLLEEARVSMEIAETSYREGEISLVEYLDARRTYQSIQIEYQQALFDWNREMAELDRAAGGGVL